MLLALLWAAAQAQMEVTVLGEGSEGGDDQQFLRVGLLIESSQASLSVALAEVSKIIEKVEAVLKKGGIKGELQIEKYEVTPLYEMDRKQNVFLGLIVKQALSFDIKSQQLKEGEFIDEIVQAGVSRVESIDWAENQQNEAKHLSRKYMEALEDAKGKAEALCNQAGYTVKSLISFQQQQNEETEEQQSPFSEPGTAQFKATFGCGPAPKKKKGKQADL